MYSHLKKIITIKKVLEIVKKERKKGKRIVTTNGSFDIFHAGHALTLAISKQQGDILIVGVNSDESVRGYKSPKRPIVPERWRAEVVAAVEYVDFVFFFDELNPIEFIKKIKPDIHTNSAEFGADCIEKDAVEEGGGKVFLIEKIEGISTTDIINKIKGL